MTISNWLDAIISLIAENISQDIFSEKIPCPILDFKEDGSEFSFHLNISTGHLNQQDHHISVTCVESAGVITAIHCDGNYSKYFDEENEEVSLLWEECLENLQAWIEEKKSDRHFKVRKWPHGGNEITFKKNGHPITLRVTSGTPPNKTEFPLTGKEAKPFWALCFL